VQPTYWWRYPKTDAEKLDIKQLPCGSSCTLAELESACLSTAGCVAFNTDGWLKNSIADMAPDTCDLYVKKTTPQPSPTPPPAISFWPIPINVSYGPGNVTVSPNLAYVVSPPAAAAAVQAYAAHINDVVFMNTPASPLPSGSLVTVNINVADANVPLQLGVDESYTLIIPGRDADVLCELLPVPPLLPERPCPICV
jgi:hypothetical protein